MGRISKYGIDRLGQRNFRIEMDCPQCGRARIRIAGGNDQHLPDEAVCPKCGVHVLLDAINITVLNDAVPHAEAQACAVPAPAAAGR